MNKVQETYKVAYLRLEVERARGRGTSTLYADKEQFPLSHIVKLNDIEFIQYTCFGVEYWRMKVIKPGEDQRIGGPFYAVTISNKELADVTLEGAEELDKRRMNLVERRERYKREIKLKYNCLNYN